MLSRGIVTNVQAAGGDDRGEAGKGALPDLGAHSGSFDGTPDTLGFRSPGSRINGETFAGLAEQREQFFLERVWNALGGIFADPETDRDGGARRTRLAEAQERFRTAHPEGLLGPGDRKSTRLNSSHVSISYAV